MSVTVRLPEALYQTIVADLDRPHPFAAERVGFLSVRAGSLGRGILLLGTRYAAVADDDYVEDPLAGARIGGAAIRSALGLALPGREGVLHVHKHFFPGVPAPSRMDAEELPRLVASFRAVAPRLPHGFLILSEDSAAAFVWPPGGAGPVRAERVSVVGFPLRVMGGRGDE